jgi:hypothetical protein
VVVVAAAAMAGCGGSSLVPVSAPGPSPPVAVEGDRGVPVRAPVRVPVPAAVAAPAASGRVLTLPARVFPTGWRVEREGTMEWEGTREVRRTREEAQLSLQWERDAGGWLRGRGQVAGYRLTAGDGGVLTVPSLAVLLVVDSGATRVVPDPPLVAGCDREELTAAQLAAVVAVRIPDGSDVGSRWEERSAGVECRAGVPVRVIRRVRGEVVRWSGDTVTVAREVSVVLEGKGGRPFEVVRVGGEGTERQELQLSASRGIVTRGEGRGVVRLRVWEGPREAGVRQEVRWRVEGLNP